MSVTPRKFAVGQSIEVIETRMAMYPIHGEILELDEHPFQGDYAKIRVDSPALPALEIWVALRLAKIIEGTGSEPGKESKVQ